VHCKKSFSFVLLRSCLPGWSERLEPPGMRLGLNSQ
jgi:hypothetical protein